MRTTKTLTPLRSKQTVRFDCVLPVKTVRSSVNKVGLTLTFPINQIPQIIPSMITFTNAACEDIQRRLFFDANFMISTIHSFCWDLINPFTADIKMWLKKELTDSINELARSIEKSIKPDGPTAQRNRRSLISKTQRIKNLDTIQNLSYSHNSNRPEKGTLNHAEVLEITACVDCCNVLFGGMSPTFVV